jgi:hypothetical protein
MRPRVCYPYPYSHNEVNEVNKRGVGRCTVAIFPFTSGCMAEVNEVNGRV